MALTSADMARPDRVEQATAQPGERRNVKIPADKSRCDATNRLAEGRVRCRLEVDHDGNHVWFNDAANGE